MMLPRMPGCKTAAFTSRLVAFNETFALMGKHAKGKRKHIAVAWHEATAGRKAEEIAAAYAKALKYERRSKQYINTGSITAQLKTKIGAYLHC